MSRDQKPGKVKLVSGAGTNYGRRAGDKIAGQPVPATTAEGVQSAEDQAAEVSRSRGLLMPVLFLVFCAFGGSGAVFLGLAGNLAR